MHKASYIQAYNMTVKSLNKPFKDMRDTPEDAIINSINSTGIALSIQSFKLSEQQRDQMLTELRNAQQEAKATGSGKFSEKSWRWPEKPEPVERILNHHFVTDRPGIDD